MSNKKMPKLCFDVLVIIISYGPLTRVLQSLQPYLYKLMKMHLKALDKANKWTLSQDYFCQNVSLPGMKNLTHFWVPICAENKSRGVKTRLDA